MSTLTRWVNGLNASKKLLISLLIGAVAYLVFPFHNTQSLTHLLFSWDIFTLFQLLLSWITFYSTTPSAIRKQARRQDDNSIVIFFIVLIATCCSMLAVILLLISQSSDPSTKTIRLIIAIACMLLSWFLVHTIFTIRYARLYYSGKKNIELNGRRNTEDSEDAAGLIFPNDDEPDFLDFAYFSFTAGMTFQVSDVDISAKPIRRLALLHCLISFGYNATIIALSVNVIGSLSQS